MRPAHLACLAALSVAAGPALAGPAACSDSVPCTTSTGSYYVRPPAGWDGRSPLPTAVFLHGYSGSAEAVMADDGLRKALSDAGVLLVAPEGLAPPGQERSWSLPALESLGRDDVAFIGDVVADVAGRFPVDRERLVATGFSVGGSMVWYLACHGGPFAAYAPVAGAFWKPEPTECSGGPQSLRHVHGKADRTVPMMGRTIHTGGGTIAQGDVMNGMATWRRIDGCAEEPDSVSRTGALECRTWSRASCRSGRELVLCLHPGEHEIDPAWVVEGMRWADALARAKSGP